MVQDNCGRKHKVLKYALCSWKNVYRQIYLPVLVISDFPSFISWKFFKILKQNLRVNIWHGVEWSNILGCILEELWSLLSFVV